MDHFLNKVAGVVGPIFLSFLRIWSHLLKKSIIENFIFLCSVMLSRAVFKTWSSLTLFTILNSFYTHFYIRKPKVFSPKTQNVQLNVHKTFRRRPGRLIYVLSSERLMYVQWVYGVDYFRGYKKKPWHEIAKQKLFFCPKQQHKMFAYR